VILPRPEAGGEGGRQWGPRFQVVRGEGPFVRDGEALRLAVRPIARIGWRLVAHELRVAGNAAVTEPRR